MFTFEKTKTSIIKNLVFNKSLDYFSKYSKGVKDDTHSALAKIFSEHQYKCCLVMMTEEHLDEKLYEDPSHLQITNHLLVSEVEEEARDRVERSYYSSDELEKIFKEREYPRKTYNWKTDPKREIEHQITDAIFQSQAFEYYPDVVALFKEMCKYDYDEETGDEIRLTKSAAKKRWEKRLKEIHLPRVSATYERVYPNTPKPFNYWDHRNPWQQYFFIDQGDHIAWTKGGSGGSHQRYENGLLSHTFAMLEHDYDFEIPTYYFEHSSMNEFKFVDESKCLRLISWELTGNYREDLQKTKYLFQGKLVDYDFDSKKILFRKSSGRIL